jgi:DNA-directed RNA polymerase subunit A"
MTMRTYHLAGASEIKVTLGLPRLVEIFDARRSPKTPTMAIYLEKSLPDSTSGYYAGAEYNVDPYSANSVLSIDSNSNGMILGAAHYALNISH